MCSNPSTARLPRSPFRRDAANRFACLGGADPRVGVVAVQGRQATLDKPGSQVVARQLRRTPLRPQFDGLVHGRGIAE